jgi:LysM repeat protein
MRVYKHISPQLLLIAYLGTLFIGLFVFIAILDSPNAMNYTMDTPTLAADTSHAITDPTLLSKMVLVPTTLSTSDPRPTIPSISITLTPTIPSEIDTSPQVFTYTIKAGDTLSAIADRFGIDPDELRAANNINGDLIYPGDKLWIAKPSSEETNITPAQSIIEPTNPIHMVFPGETLESIALEYGVTVEDLRSENFMYGNAILPGQKLSIPIKPTKNYLPYHFSPLGGDLLSAYPLSFEEEGFTLHYRPNSYSVIDPEAVGNLVSVALSEINSTLQAQLLGRFDIFAAGTVFEPPNCSLRGRSFSYLRQSFFLNDGSGDAPDQQYIVTHEITHLFSWNVFGKPVSALVSEGAAVYIGMLSIANSDHIPLQQFCRAYLQARKLPQVSTSLIYEGHSLYLENYYAAGCFIGYLINTYGPKKFGHLYSTGNYEAIYGASLPALEQDWLNYLNSQSEPLAYNPEDLVASVNAVEQAYYQFFLNFNGTSSQLDAYIYLDQARLALLKGHMKDVQGNLDSFRSLFH